MKKFTKEELMNTYIVNDHGELREKYINACISVGYAPQRGGIEPYDRSFIKAEPTWLRTVVGRIAQTYLREAISDCTEITLEDFKDTPTTPEINWDEAPEGYDYWIDNSPYHFGYDYWVVPKFEPFLSDFHYLKDGKFYNNDGYGWLEDSLEIEVYKRPEPAITPATLEINWDNAPEGYDYWAVPESEEFSLGFHCLKDGYFYDKDGYRWREGNPSIEVYKRPEPDSVPTTPEIDWSKAPEGYDYWVVPKLEGFSSCFHYLKNGGFYDKGGCYWLEDSPSIEVYKRPEPDSAPCNGKEVTPRWKYTEVVVKSIFDLREDLEEGKLFYGELKRPICDEHQLMILIVKNEDQIYQRVEVKWQDEVEEYLQGCHSGQGMFDIVYDNGISSLADEDFLEVARIALRGTGEL